MRRLIVLILTVIIVLPFFDGGLDSNVGGQYQEDGLQQLHNIQANAYGSLTTLTPMEKEDLLKANVLEYVRNSGKLVNMRIGSLDPMKLQGWIDDIKFQDCTDSKCGYTEASNPENDWSAADYIPKYENIAEEFRTSEINAVAGSGCVDSKGVYNYASETYTTDECTSIAAFDIKDDTTLEAGFNMVKTLFVMFMMALGAIMFQQDAQLLVIGPIERMMDLVTSLAENPMGATQTEDDMLDEDKRARKQGYETALLESTLTKVGQLLQVGFGAAGAEIIAHNMAQGSEIDPMVPGKMITSVYGFCDIRQFTDTTECLQEEVMVYVNKLGDIVHGCTHNYYGMANKNIGDAFLLSWKVCNGQLKGFSNFLDKPNEEHRLAAASVKCPANMGAGRRNRRINPTEMADSALTAFIKALIDLDNANETGNLNVYRHHKRVIKRFGDNFKIKMGFGMHVGWAIEGAIGTTYKIDATYLSPQVEMSDRLEAGSKIFGTPLNLSHWFVALLSPGARKFLRPIDTILVSGCPTPMTVYTYDVLNMKSDFGVPKFKSNGEQLPVDFENDPQYKEIQKDLNDSFKPTFANGYQKYIAGDWGAAKDFLVSANQLMVDSGVKTGDGPTRQLMGFMETHNFKAPENWRGVHELDGY
jgi:class 3 adenylate cyclase